MEKVGAVFRQLLPWGLAGLAAYLWWRGEYGPAATLIAAAAVLPIDKGNGRSGPPATRNA